MDNREVNLKCSTKHCPFSRTSILNNTTSKTEKWKALYCNKCILEVESIRTIPRARMHVHNIRLHYHNLIQTFIFDNFCFQQQTFEDVLKWFVAEKPTPATFFSYMELTYATNHQCLHNGVQNNKKGFKQIWCAQLLQKAMSDPSMSSIYTSNDIQLFIMAQNGATTPVSTPSSSISATQSPPLCIITPRQVNENAWINSIYPFCVDYWNIQPELHSKFSTIQRFADCRNRTVEQLAFTHNFHQLDTNLCKIPALRDLPFLGEDVTEQRRCNIENSQQQIMISSTPLFPPIYELEQDVDLSAQARLKDDIGLNNPEELEDDFINEDNGFERPKIFSPSSTVAIARTN